MAHICSIFGFFQVTIVMMGVFFNWRTIKLTNLINQFSLTEDAQNPANVIARSGNSLTFAFSLDSVSTILKIYQDKQVQCKFKMEVY